MCAGTSTYWMVRPRARLNSCAYSAIVMEWEPVSSYTLPMCDSGLASTAAAATPTSAPAINAVFLTPRLLAVTANIGGRFQVVRRNRHREIQNRTAFHGCANRDDVEHVGDHHFGTHVAKAVGTDVQVAHHRA